MPKRADTPVVSSSDDGSPDSIDAAAAERAYLSIEPRLLALPLDRVTTLQVDLQRVAIKTAAIGRFIREPAIRKRFASLPAAEFQQAHVEDVLVLAQAAWHAGVEQRVALAASSEAKLPVSLVNEATQVKQRMLRLVTYHFAEDPVDGAEIASIVQGTGYDDLASDLVRLARLYKKHGAAVKRDPKNYVASDATDARKLAQHIVDLLGEARNQEQKSWNDLVNRLWTVLSEVYAEVSAAGRWLFRHDDPEGRFPSLFVVGRPHAGRRTGGKAAPEGDAPAGAPSTPQPG